MSSRFAWRDSFPLASFFCPSFPVVFTWNWKGKQPEKLALFSSKTKNQNKRDKRVILHEKDNCYIKTINATFSLKSLYSCSALLKSKILNHLIIFRSLFYVQITMLPPMHSSFLYSVYFLKSLNGLQHQDHLDRNRIIFISVQRYPYFFLNHIKITGTPSGTDYVPSDIFSN